jgi:enamine deaminase RidA (YjgF/YER057c/UK114 family)
VVAQPAKTINTGGQNGVDAHGKVVGPTVGEEASQALRNLATILESEGASLANVMHWTIAVVDSHALDEGFAAFQQAGTRPTHRRPSQSTSSPAWAVRPLARHRSHRWSSCRSHPPLLEGQGPGRRVGGGLFLEAVFVRLA